MLDQAQQPPKSTALAPVVPSARGRSSAARQNCHAASVLFLIGDDDNNDNGDGDDDDEDDDR